MADISIPPAALEAGKRAYESYVLDIASEDAIRAACLAMIEAWPGNDVDEDHIRGPRIILPLPQEASDDQ